MNKKTKDKIVDLFKTGNFSIVYTNQGDCTVYSKSGITSDDDWEDVEEFKVCELDEEDGYLPYVVWFLADALGGTTDSF